MKVRFLPQDVTVDIRPDQSVMAVAHENGVKIKSVCNGMPSCAECRVRIVEGEHNVLPPSRKELSLIGTGYFIDQRRLSCQLLCFGDVVIDLSEQIEKEKAVKRPQGSVRKEPGQESHAVSGNLIEQEGILAEPAPQERGDAEERVEGRAQIQSDGTPEREPGARRRRRRRR